MTVIQHAHVDYTREPFYRWQWTFPTSTAGVLVQLLGILITIALAQLWILLQSMWFARDRVRNPARHAAQVPAEPARLPLSLWEFIIKSLQEALHEYVPPVQLAGAPPQARWKVLAWKISLVIFAFILFIGILALGAVSNNLTGDSKVLITSKDCGAYVPVSTSNLQAFAVFEAKAQHDAQQYARLCYGGRSLDYRCDQFAHKAIEYYTKFNDDCPWPNGLCQLGAKGAITFKTGPVPASQLGVNAKQNLQFERSTTCAPVNMNATYITQSKAITHDGCKADIFIYHYGWTKANDQDNVSWVSIKYDNPWDRWSGYYVDSVVQMPSHYDGPPTGFTAIPEMVPPYGSVLNIIFIESGRIFYTAPSDDPIFPTTSRVDPPKNPYIDNWIYEGGHARVLACIDYSRWRNLEHGDDWHERDEMPVKTADHIDGKEWLLYLSIKNSNTRLALSQVGGLNASTLLTGYISLPLDTKQWEVEATQLFETSLARAQFEASYMSQGTYAAYEGWNRTSPESVSPQYICGHNYLGNDPDFANVNGTIYLFVLVPCLLVIALSCPWDETLIWEWLLGQDRAGRWVDAMVQGVQALSKATYRVVKHLWKGLSWLYSQLRTILGDCFISASDWIRQQWLIISRALHRSVDGLVGRNRRP